MVESLNTRFDSFSFVEMLVNYRCLGFSKTDEVDDVRKNFNQSIMCRSQKIRKGEVVYAALDVGRSILHSNFKEESRIYLNEKLPE